ncbi:MAG: V-type ATPase subunit [Actinomycetota bacterium]|nr:V-type ATPase subunit [Actinomycetota bacterium]
MEQINYNIRDDDIRDDNFYLFTCAELKARELEFLDKSKIDRISKSKNLKEFIKNLGDTVYSGYLSELEESRSFAGVIAGEYSGFAEYLSGRLKSSHRHVREILFFEEILHNLKIVFKSIILDEGHRELFMPLFYSYEKLKRAAEERKYNGLSRSVSATLRYASEMMESKEEKDYRILEFKIEKFYLNEVFKSFGELDSRLIKEYMKHLIDILNIKNIYRSKYLGEEMDPGYFLHDNGYLPVDLMMKLGKSGLDDFLKKMKGTGYGSMVARCADALDSNRKFFYFEREEDLFYMNILEPLKYTVSNVEKIFKFFLRKKMELKSLNIIFTGVLYNVDTEKVKERAGF